MVSDEGLSDLVGQYSLDLDIEDSDLLRSQGLEGILEEVAKQHGKRFFLYSEPCICAANHSHDKIRIATDVGCGDCGEGKFSIRRYHATPLTTEKGRIYPVTNYMLEFEGLVKGYGVKEFEQRFR